MRRAKYNKKLIIDDTEVTDQACILNHIKDFYETQTKTYDQNKRFSKGYRCSKTF